MKGTISAANLENNGTLTLAPAAQAATITGSFSNAGSAVLSVPFFTDGSTALITAGSAVLSGTLRYKPVRGTYYKTGTLSLNRHPVLLASGALPATDFTDVSFVSAAEIDSPILHMTLNTGAAASENSVTITRTSYTAYAAGSETACQVGAALNHIAETASGTTATRAAETEETEGARQASGSSASADVTALIAALDWSSSDGSDIVYALPRLAPGAYNTLVKISLARQEQVSSILSTRTRTLIANSQLARSAHASDKAPAGTHAVWAQPVASHEADQRTEGYHTHLIVFSLTKQYVFSAPTVFQPHSR